MNKTFLCHLTVNIDNFLFVYLFFGKTNRISDSAEFPQNFLLSLPLKSILKGFLLVLKTVEQFRFK